VLELPWEELRFVAARDALTTNEDVVDELLSRNDARDCVTRRSRDKRRSVTRAEARRM
jgi:hypothetical protein